MRRFAALIGLAVLVVAPAARAEGLALHLAYTTYAAGFTTLGLAATVDFTPDGYRMSLDYHTVGLVGFLFPGHAMVRADGRWSGDGVRSEHFRSEGFWSGRSFQVLMDDADGIPEIRRLVPSEAERREPVPAALQEGTMDTVSAMALLLHQMVEGGTCGRTVRIFDGRRLMIMASQAAGSETLGVTSRSFFHGPALRCDLTGKVLGGFLRSDGAEERRRVSHGAVWFARPVAGLPRLPVRIVFTARWFGTAMMYLTDVQTERVGSLPAASRLALTPPGRASQGGQAAR